MYMADANPSGYLPLTDQSQRRQPNMTKLVRGPSHGELHCMIYMYHALEMRLSIFSPTEKSRKGL